MYNNDSEDQLYFSYSDIPFECPYRQQAGLYRPMHPQGNPPQGGGNMPPVGPPPSITHSQHNMQAEPMAVDPGAIKHCIYKYVYIYPRRGRAYWAWLTFVGRRSVAGYKWTGRNWVYFGIDLKQIESFYCQ